MEIVMGLDKETFFWYFSTCAQVFGSLIAIMAVFTVYAHEWIQSSIEWSRNDLIRLFGHYAYDRNLENLTLDFQLKSAKDWLRDNENKHGQEERYGEINRVIDVIEKQRERRKIITDKFLRLVKLMLFVLATSLISLPFSSFNKNYKPTLITILVIVLLLSILSLIYAGSFIKKTLSR